MNIKFDRIIILNKRDDQGRLGCIYPINQASVVIKSANDILNMKLLEQDAEIIWVEAANGTTWAKIESGCSWGHVQHGWLCAGAGGVNSMQVLKI